LRDLYGIEVSPDLISAVTDAVLEEVSPWQARPLEAVYPLIFFDALQAPMAPRKSSASGSRRNGRLRVMGGKPLTEHIFSAFAPITDL
jgi:mutator family transposase